ncbi:MAG: hypothetical protein AAF483_19950 [Planctomycetota bacterium]
MKLEKLMCSLCALALLVSNGYLLGQENAAEVQSAGEAALEKEVPSEEGELEKQNTKAAKKAARKKANESAKGKTKFLRLKERKGEPKTLDTAVVTYTSKKGEGVSVDLIGAVHVGEGSYYEELNKLFDDYEVLLYELVAPEGATIPRGGPKESGGFNPVSMLQNGTRSMLGLEFQLEKIDYTKKHFVRADMTPSQMADKMKERGDTAFTIALDTFSDMMRQQNKLMKNPEAAKEVLGFDPEEVSLSDMLGNPLKMKRILANQFAQSGSLDQAMGKSLNQLLIVDRNEAALIELQKQIAAGRKKIGIFYGAAHLPDFEEHLVADFGFAKKRQRWVEAWDLTTAKKPELDKSTELLLNVLKLLEK